MYGYMSTEKIGWKRFREVLVGLIFESEPSKLRSAVYVDEDSAYEHTHNTYIYADYLRVIWLMLSAVKSEILKWLWTHDGLNDHLKVYMENSADIRIILEVCLLPSVLMRFKIYKG